MTIAEWRKQRRGQKSGSNSGLHVNVGEAERNASMIGGTVLAVSGLLRGHFSGLMLAGLGGTLIYRGHSGHCDFYEALGHSTADESQSSGCSLRTYSNEAAQREDEGAAGCSVPSSRAAAEEL